MEVGSRLAIELRSLIPRSVTPKTIGFQFDGIPGDEGYQQFNHLIATLKKAELERLTVL